MYVVVLAYEGILGGKRKNQLEPYIVEVKNFDDAKEQATQLSLNFMRNFAPLKEAIKRSFSATDKEFSENTLKDLENGGWERLFEMNVAYDIFPLLLPDEQVRTYEIELGEMLYNDTNNFVLCLCGKCCEARKDSKLATLLTNSFQNGVDI